MFCSYFSRLGDPQTLPRVVRLTVNDGSSTSNIATVYIDFSAVNDPPRVDLNGPFAPGIDYTVDFYEGSAGVGIASINATIYDPDSVNISWASVEIEGLLDTYPVEHIYGNVGAENNSALGGNSQSIKISGEASLAEYRWRSLDLKYVNVKDEPTPGIRTVSVYVYDDDGAKSPLATTNITIVAVNDNSPVFDFAMFAGSIEEGDALNRPVVTVSATDADQYGDDQITYSIQGGSSLFKIDSMTGEITTAGALDYDVPGGHEHYLTVVAHDHEGQSNSRSGTADVHITVIDVNDNVPLFRQSEWRTTKREDIASGGSIVTVEATDRDSNENAHITYSIDRSGSGSGSGSGSFIPFEIDSSTGEVTTTRDLDFEMGDVEYDFTVTATDGGDPALSSTAQIYVTIENVNDNSPIFDQSSYSESVSEGAAMNTVVVTVSASDADSGTLGDLRYELVNADMLPFDVKTQSDGLSAQIFVSGPLDYETTAQYSFKIAAIDGGMPARSSEALVDISVTDENDNSPVFQQEIYTMTVSELIEQDQVILTIRALDDDELDVVTYSLSGPADLFAVDSSTGDVRIAGALDYETTSLHEFSAIASDGVNTDTAILRVGVTNENDESPTFGSDVYSTNVSENASIGSHVIVVSAVDKDAGAYGNVTYRITAGNDMGHFEIHSTSGEISVRTSLNFEAKRLFRLTVVAEDGGNPPRNGSTSVVIRVTNVNDILPKIVLPTTAFDFVEDGAPISIGAGATVTDEDGDNIVRAVFQLDAPPNDAVVDQNMRERLTIDASGSPQLAVVYSSSHQTITVTGSASPDVYEAVVASLMYENTFDEPPPGRRNVSVIVYDSLHEGNAMATVNVTLRDDHLPQLTAVRTTFAFNESGSAVDVGAQVGLAVQDGDRAPHNRYRQLRVSFPLLPDGLAEGLSFDLTGSTLSAADKDGTLLSGNASVSSSLYLESNDPVDAEEFLRVFRTIFYDNSKDEPTPGTREFNVTVRTGDVVSNVLRILVDVVTANDNAPIVSVSNSSIHQYVEESGYLDVGKLAGFVVSDKDDSASHAINSASVILIDAKDGNDEEIDVTPMNGITIVPAMNALTLVGPAPASSFQAALATLRYRNLQSEPAAGLRNVSVSVEDGIHLSNTVTIQIDVVLIDDSPLLMTTNGNRLSHVQNADDPLDVAGEADLNLIDVDVGSRVSEIVIELVNASAFESVSLTGVSGANRIVIPGQLTAQANVRF